ncbi:MAG: hypothetical protein V1905_02685 [bacterium]
MNIIIAVLFGVSALIFSQWFVRSLLGWLNGQVEKSIPDLKITADKMKAEGADTENFEEEIAGIYLVRHKRKQLWIFASIIGAMETVFFVSATLVTLIVFFPDPFEAMSTIIKFVAGWLAMKSIGSYRQWTGTVFGRIYYYIFIIGSLANTTLAITAGYIIYFLILNF